MASNDLSPAARRIAQLALSHFAEQGYDAASMNDIAVLAGLKKASLYAHFTSKDELYRAALELALAAEAEHVRAQFAAGEGRQEHWAKATGSSCGTGTRRMTPCDSCCGRRSIRRTRSGTP